MTAQAPALRIAVELIDDDGATDWTELTVPSSAAGAPRRIRVTSLAEAQRATAHSNEPVFVDVDVLLDDTVAAGLARYRAAYPDWRLGSSDSPLAHPGTARSLAGLLWDIRAAEVADGVTLRVASSDFASREKLESVTALLAVRGVEFRTAHAA